jgi:long-chain fatty acid transport protein
MAQLDKIELSVTGTYVMPDISLTGLDAPTGIDPIALNDIGIAPSAIIPTMYLIVPLNDKFSLGFGAFSNFGLATEFDDEYAAGQLAGMPKKAMRQYFQSKIILLIQCVML